MQQRISDNIHLGKTVSPFESIGESKAIDGTAQKAAKIKRMVIKGEYNEDIARYIPGILKINVPECD